MVRVMLLVSLLSACATSSRAPSSEARDRQHHDDMYRVLDDAKALKLPVNDDGVGLFFCYRKLGTLDFFGKEELVLGGLEYEGYPMHLFSYIGHPAHLVQMKQHASSPGMHPFTDNGIEYQFQQLSSAFGGPASLVTKDMSTDLMCYRFFEYVN